MNIGERDAYFDRIIEAVEAREMTWGQAVRGLRKDVAGMKQTTFAKVAGISVRTLRKLEQDEGNPTMATMEAVLRPFGMTVGIRRKS